MKTFQLLIVLFLVLFAAFSPLLAFASQDAEFQPLKDKVWNWIKGNLAMTIVGTALLVGAAGAVGGRIGALAACVVIAIAFGVGPDVLTNLVGATKSVPW